MACLSSLNRQNENRERNRSRNTQRSYRDAIRLLVIYASANLHRKVDDLVVSDIHAELLRKFLRYIEETRKCSIASRNQRLAAVHGIAVLHRYTRGV
jgi:integrase/recombinase XerD